MVEYEQLEVSTIVLENSKHRRSRRFDIAVEHFLVLNVHFQDVVLGFLVLTMQLLIRKRKMISK